MKDHRKRSKKRKIHSSSSSESSSSDSESSSDDNSNHGDDNKERERNPKTIVIANERLLQKLLARNETIEERKARRAQARATIIESKLGYTADDNSFNDPNSALNGNIYMEET